MAVDTNTVQTYASIGNREDLSDMIYNIDPFDTPFLSRCKKDKAKAHKVEWLTDSFAAANGDNKVVEGDNPAADAYAAPTRLNAYTQLMDKVVVVSSRQDAIETAGRKKELSYQVAKRGKELKRDMETRLLGAYSNAVGNASTASETGAVQSWIATNCGVGATGAAPTGDGTDVPTGGTNRTFTQALLDAQLANVYTQGGDPDTVMVSAALKQTASGFAGIATQYRENSGVKQATILAAADIYVSDFGELKIVPNRFIAAECAYILDMEYWCVSHLQSFKVEELAKTGHAEKRMLSVEFALKSLNEAASGALYDLDA